MAKKINPFLPLVILPGAYKCSKEAQYHIGKIVGQSKQGLGFIVYVEELNKKFEIPLEYLMSEQGNLFEIAKKIYDEEEGHEKEKAESV